MRRTTIGIALAAALLPCVAGAQQWRTIETARQLTNTEPLQVTLTFAGGKFELKPLPGQLLYQMQLHYDAQATDAMHEYEAADHQLKLGMRDANMGLRALKAMKHDEGTSMTVGLNPTVPINLELNLGGSEAEAELGGMSVKSLRIHMGLAGGKVAFSSPNRVVMDQLSVEVGLGGAAIENLDNANVSQININGGMGGVALGFGDHVMRDVKINADVAFGGLKIQVPESVGVSLQASTRMASFKPQGFDKIDGTWVTPNWKQATTRVTIIANAALGSLEVNHAAP